MSKKRKPNEDQLIAAINRRDIELLQKHLANGADPNSILHFGTNETLLGYACGCLFLEAVKLLLKLGADPNKRAISEASIGGVSATALDNVNQGHDADILEEDLEKKKIEIINVLLSAGADVNADCPLYTAARGGYFEICKRLIEAGARVKELPPGCIPPLFGAVYNCADAEKRDKVVNLLIENGAAIDAETPNGSSPLIAAARRGIENLVNLFLERGADPNRQTRNDGQTALTYAALYFKYDAFEEKGQQRALRVVERLLEAGADPAVRNEEGESAFDIASGGKSPLVADCIKRFTEKRSKSR
jgi:ankyrin repeat protein